MRDLWNTLVLISIVTVNSFYGSLSAVLGNYDMTRLWDANCYYSLIYRSCQLR